MIIPYAKRMSGNGRSLAASALRFRSFPVTMEGSGSGTDSRHFREGSMQTIRQATGADLARIGGIYERIHTAEEEGRAMTGWVRGVYPTEATARAALARGELFVLETGGVIGGAAILNHAQLPCYTAGDWRTDSPAERVLVMHTLTVDPALAGRGLGTAFVRAYEAHARAAGCDALRMDTRETNLAARSMYRRCGFREAGSVMSEFNGIPDVPLVLLEKVL